MADVRIQSWFADGRKRPLLEATVADLLEIVPKRDLVGLECITIRDQPSLSRSEKREKVRTKGGKKPKSKLNGMHRMGRRKSGSQIELYVDNIFAPYPDWAQRFRIMRRVLLGEVLYHELGHHRHEQGAAMGSKESQADIRRDQLWKEYLAKRYPVLSTIGRLFGTAHRWTATFRRRR